MNGYIQGYMEKRAGLGSEWFNIWRLLSWPISDTVGGIPAAFTDTKNTPEMADMDTLRETIKNHLIPGYGSYKLWKRTGYGARGEDILNAKKDLRKRLAEMQRQGMSKGEAIKQLRKELEVEEAQDKQANIWSESIGAGLNPLNWLALPIAGLIALSTKTRTTDRQALNDIREGTVWKDLLVPGVAPYNMYKRVGYAFRNEDLKDEKKQREMARNKKRGEKELNKLKQKEEEKSAMEKGAGEGSEWSDLRRAIEIALQAERDSNSWYEQSKAYDEANPEKPREKWWQTWRPTADEIEKRKLPPREAIEQALRRMFDRTSVQARDGEYDSIMGVGALGPDAEEIEETFNRVYGGHVPIIQFNPDPRFSFDG